MSGLKKKSGTTRLTLWWYIWVWKQYFYYFYLFKNKPGSSMSVLQNAKHYFPFQTLNIYEHQSESALNFLFVLSNNSHRFQRNSKSPQFPQIYQCSSNQSPIKPILSIRFMTFQSHIYQFNTQPTDLPSETQSAKSDTKLRLFWFQSTGEFYRHHYYTIAADSQPSVAAAVTAMWQLLPSEFIVCQQSANKTIPLNRPPTQRRVDG